MKIATTKVHILATLRESCWSEEMKSFVWKLMQIIIIVGAVEIFRDQILKDVGLKYAKTLRS